MQTIDSYSNRNLDAQLMHQRLVWGRNITTEQANKVLAALKPQREDMIRNYKSTDMLDNQISTLQLLIQDRERWSEFCCDDVSHWAGAL